ncbi:MAG: sulfatase-like hydrolase/transferase, partial [Phycisphaeraceae bacterium]
MSDHHAPPNLLFLFPDQWRWDWLGCESSPYGKMPVRTPNIDALARRGVRFTRCRSNSPLCAPARACLATGMRYERCGVSGNGYDLDPERTTVFNRLRDAGYRTLTCGKNDLHKKTTWKGREGWTRLLGQYGFTDAIDQSGKLDAKQWGAVDKGGPHCSYTSYLHANGQFDTYADDYQRRAQEATHFAAAWPSPLAREHYTDDFCGRTALELLDRQPNEGPWMLWVNFPGPHDPFDPPRELQARYDGVAFPEPVAGKAEHLRKDGSAVPLNHQQIRRNYAAACEGIDEWVGRIMDKVAQRGELENTVVVFSSDHGEMLGDHGRFLKNVPQEGSVHVPLIIAGPGIQKGAVSDALVELIDISATLLEAAGLECPGDWDALPLGSVLR